MFNRFGGTLPVPNFAQFNHFWTPKADSTRSYLFPFHSPGSAGFGSAEHCVQVLRPAQPPGQPHLECTADFYYDSAKHLPTHITGVMQVQPG